MPRHEVQNLWSVPGIGLAVVYHTSWSRYVLLYHVSNLNGRSKPLIVYLGPNDVVRGLFAHTGSMILEASSLALMNISNDRTMELGTEAHLVGWRNLAGVFPE